MYNTGTLLFFFLIAQPKNIRCNYKNLLNNVFKHIVKQKIPNKVIETSCLPLLVV
jgi:hypothetical protein